MFGAMAKQRRKVEMLFAHLKQHLGLRRLKLRGLSGAREEFLLAAAAQNLRAPGQTDRTRYRSALASSLRTRIAAGRTPR